MTPVLPYPSLAHNYRIQHDTAVPFSLIHCYRIPAHPLLLRRRFLLALVEQLDERLLQIISLDK